MQTRLEREAVADDQTRQRARARWNAEPDLRARYQGTPDPYAAYLAFMRASEAGRVLGLSAPLRTSKILSEPVYDETALTQRVARLYAAGAISEPRSRELGELLEESRRIMGSYYPTWLRRLPFDARAADVFIGIAARARTTTRPASAAKVKPNLAPAAIIPPPVARTAPAPAIARAATPADAFEKFMRRVWTQGPRTCLTVDDRKVIRLYTSSVPDPHFFAPFKAEQIYGEMVETLRGTDQTAVARLGFPARTWT